MNTKEIVTPHLKWIDGKLHQFWLVEEWSGVPLGEPMRVGERRNLDNIREEWREVPSEED